MNSEKKIPGFLLADLFRTGLVIIDDDPGTVLPAKPIEEVIVEKIIISEPIPKTTVPIEERQWFLGNHLKKITILVNDPEAVYLGDESLQFLSNILGACKLNLGDVAIVNYHNDPVSYAILKEKLNPAYLILFGVTAKEIQLPFHVPHYQVQKYDSRSFLLTPSLLTMLGNSQEAKLEKSKLWLSLKNIFGIK